MTVTFDHFFGTGDAGEVAEAAITFAAATLDDPDSSAAERDDAVSIINLGVAELARRLDAGQVESRATSDAGCRDVPTT